MKHKQKKPIFLVTSVGNLDGTVDITEDVETFDTEKKALDYAKDTADEYGMRTYVYKCVPILRVDRGRLRVTRL